MGGNYDYYVTFSAHFGSTYTKIGMIQRRLALALCKDDMQIHEAFHIFSMRKETLTPVQEALRVPYRINPRKNTPRHILIKLTNIKYKEKILKATREKQHIIYKGTPIRLSADFSAETLQARREWHDLFKVMKGKILQPRILYPARLSFRFDRESKSFTEAKLREFSTIKPALQQMLKELL